MPILIVLAGYLFGGFVLGIVPLQQAAASSGLRPGIGTALGVNFGLPILAVAIAIWQPRRWTAALGGVLLSSGYFVGAMFRADPAFWVWTPGLARQMGHPILIGAALGCAVIGSITAAVMNVLGQEADGRKPV